MEMVTLDELAQMMAREFSRTAVQLKGIDRQIESVHEQLGRLIDMDNRLVKIEYLLDETSPRKMKKRIDGLERKVFGSIQAA